LIIKTSEQKYVRGKVMNQFNYASKAVLFTATSIVALAVQVGISGRFSFDRMYAFDIADDASTAQSQVDVTEKQQAILDLKQSIANNQDPLSFRKNSDNNAQGGISALDLDTVEAEPDPVDNPLDSVAGIGQALDSVADPNTADDNAGDEAAIEAELTEEAIQVPVELINDPIATNPLLTEFNPVAVPFNFTSSLGLGMVGLYVGANQLRRKRKSLNGKSTNIVSEA
jgi:hypothetical protein